MEEKRISDCVGGFRRVLAVALPASAAAIGSDHEVPHLRFTSADLTAVPDLLELLRRESLSVGLYRLPAGGVDPQSPTARTRCTRDRRSCGHRGRRGAIARRGR